jgi:hypothetical protein
MVEIKIKISVDNTATAANKTLQKINFKNHYQNK